MKVIVGLGNPGPEYESTRHNCGFLSLDKIATDLSANYWKEECGSRVAHIQNSEYTSEEILLIKPQSFMNLSGGPVKKLLEKYKCSINDVVIIHDDMDIESGRIRVRKGGSSAGHNGLKSLISKLGTADFVRVRIGLGRAPGNKPYVDYVLSEPKDKAKEELESGCALAAEATLYLLDHTLEDTQQKYN